MSRQEGAEFVIARTELVGERLVTRYFAGFVGNKDAWTQHPDAQREYYATSALAQEDFDLLCERYPGREGDFSIIPDR